MELEPLIGRHHPVALKVRALVEPVVRRRGCELVDIQFQEGGPAPTLRIFADAPGGIGLDALEELSRTLGDLLDAEDPVPSARYALEVSSPGVDRPLTRKAHFEAALGELVLVTTAVKVDGSRKHRGILSGVDDQQVVVQVDGTARMLPLSTLDHAHTIYQFDAVQKPGKKPSQKAAAKPSTPRPSGAVTRKDGSAE